MRCARCEEWQRICENLESQIAGLREDAADRIEQLEAALRQAEVADEFHANCDECNGEEIPELCPKCFPLFDDARMRRRVALAQEQSK